MNRRVSLTRSASVWAVLVSTPLLAATNVSNRPVGMLAQPAHIAPRATRATRNRTPTDTMRRSFFILGPLSSADVRAPETDGWPGHDRGRGAFARPAAA